MVSAEEWGKRANEELDDSYFEYAVYCKSTNGKMSDAMIIGKMLDHLKRQLTKGDKN